MPGSCEKSWSQGQLILPLLEAAQDKASLTTREAYEAVAAAIAVLPEQRARRVRRGAQSVNAFEQDVRWAQQRARLQGLMRRVGPSDWEITGKGRAALRKARPGLVVTVFTTPAGAALWASCEDAAAHLDDGSVQLVFTSPPYPLLRQKAYGNLDERAYLDWLTAIVASWPRKLTGDGSIVLNLGDAWTPGRPHLSLYQERLLLRLEDELSLKLCQRFSWQNPSKMPAPAEWVTIRRVRVKPSIENLFWLSPHDHPYADNRAVLTPYSDSMTAMLKRGGMAAAARPAGFSMKDGAFAVDHGGAIPGNLIVAPNTASNDAYARGCRAAGLPVHPARFPAALPDFFTKFLTRPGDLVFDPFGGSMTTGASAERLGRRWIGSELHLDYLEGAALRFETLRQLR